MAKISLEKGKELNVRWVGETYWGISVKVPTTERRFGVLKEEHAYVNYAVETSYDCTNYFEDRNCPTTAELELSIMMKPFVRNKLEAAYDKAIKIK